MVEREQQRNGWALGSMGYPLARMVGRCPRFVLCLLFVLLTATRGGAQYITPTLTLTSNNNPSNYGSSVTLTATVSPNSDTNTVTFYYNGTWLGTATPLYGSGLATLTTSSLPASSANITATIAAGGIWATATSNNLVQRVNQVTPTVTLSSSANPSTYGDSVTFTASLAAVGGGAVPTGTVTFNKDGSAICTSVALSSGSATCAISTLTAPSHSITATYNGDSNYTTATSNPLTQTVNKLTPTVTTWPTGSAVTYGQTLASSTLSGGSASVGGSFAWNNTGTVPAGGTNSYACTFTPTDTTDYNSVNGSCSITVSKVTPSPTLSSNNNPSSYSSSVTFTVTVPAVGSGATPTGTVTFKSDGSTICSSVALSGGGAASCPISTLTAPSHSITATYNGDSNYNSATSSTLTQTVNKASSSITTNPTAGGITYGQSLSASPLTGGAGSPSGGFTWTTPTTVPPAGTPSESITYTPSDSTDYNTATGSILINVVKDTPSCTWPTAGGITYNQTLASSSLSGGSCTNTYSNATVAGTFSWTTPSTAPGAGSPSESVTFTPTDSADYNAAAGSIQVPVGKANSSITTNPTAAAITYGQTLASSPLTGGAGSPSGGFTWTTPATIPPAGAPSEGITYTPTDTTDYNTATGSIPVSVAKDTPICTWPTAGGITYGQTLASSNLSGGSCTNTYSNATVAGTFSWTTPSIAPAAGSPPESVTFTPTDSADYTIASAQVPVTVSIGQTADTGTVQVQANVGGNWVTETSTNYGAASTPESVAEGLAGTGPDVTVTAVNDMIFIEANQQGPQYNYNFQVVATAWNQAQFSQPSFVPGGVPGALEGGDSQGQNPQTVYQYSATYDGVGNILSMNDSVNGAWSNIGYDNLNRLSAATQAPVGGNPQSYCWTYDAFGNRTSQYISSQPFGGACPGSAPVIGSDLNSYTVNGGADPGTNQVVSTNAHGLTAYPTYDGAGNVIYDGANQYLYDAEGRICASVPVFGFPVMTGYAYDAEGNRVAKGTITQWSCDPSVNQLATYGNETDYILGPGGQQVTEMAQDANGSMNWQRTYLYAGGTLIGTYDPNSGSPTQPLPSFRLTDPLGTMRTTTDSAGVQQGTCTGWPFGDGQACSGDVPDNHHFTGKERDAESGNDYFGARYYASSMGRFLSPDPGWMLAVDPSNPQSWNLYAYALNNPLKFVDPTGMDCAYLNDAGTAIDQNGIDQNSNPYECNKNGGYWADGAITNFQVNDNGSYTFTSLDANLNTLYTNFNGSSNSNPSVNLDFWNYFVNYQIQQRQPQTQDASLALATALMSQGIPKLCGVGFSGTVLNKQAGASASGNGVGGNLNGQSAGTETPQASGVDMRSATPLFKTFPVGVYLSPSDSSGNSISSVSVGIDIKKIGPVNVNVKGNLYANTGTYTPNISDSKNCPD